MEAFIGKCIIPIRHRKFVNLLNVGIELVKIKNSKEKYRKYAEIVRGVLRNFDPNMTPQGLDEGYLNLQKQVDKIDSDLKDIFGDTQDPETLNQIQGNLHLYWLSLDKVWFNLNYVRIIKLRYEIIEKSYISRYAHLCVTFELEFGLLKIYSTKSKYISIIK